MATGYDDSPPYIGREMFMLPPKVLLFRDEQEEDDLRDRMINLLIGYLEEKHIGYTTDINDIQTVQMSIIFINKSFVRNCTQFFDRFMKERYRSCMRFTVVFYENHESKLVNQMLNRFMKYPDFGPEAGQEEGRLDKKEYRRLAKLVSRFTSSANVNYGVVPFSKNWDDIQIAIDKFVPYVVKELNTFALDFSKIHADLLSHTVDLSYDLYTEAVLRPQGSSLIAVFEGCGGDCCQLSTISKLLWTLVNHRSRGPFSYSLYLSKSQLIHGEPPSLFNLFCSEFAYKYLCDSLTIYHMMSTFFIVIDGLEYFVSKEEDDPKILLANFVNKLGKGSLVITTCGTDIITTIPTHPTIKMQTRGHVQGTKCTHSQPDTTQRPACFTILNSQLNELVLKPEVSKPDSDFEMEESDDEMELSGAYEKGNNVHLIDFDESEGSALKKLRDSLCESVRPNFMIDP